MNFYLFQTFINKSFTLIQRFIYRLINSEILIIIQFYLFLINLIIYRLLLDLTPKDK